MSTWVLELRVLTSWDWLSINGWKFCHQIYRRWRQEIDSKTTVISCGQAEVCNISGTRGTDSNSDGQIEPKNTIFVKFPKVFGKNFATFVCSEGHVLSGWVKYSLNWHRRLLGDLAMLFHSPYTVNPRRYALMKRHETTNDLIWACLEVLRVWRHLLYFFATVTVFAPSPVLYNAVRPTMAHYLLCGNQAWKWCYSCTKTERVIVVHVHMRLFMLLIRIRSLFRKNFNSWSNLRVAGLFWRGIRRRWKLTKGPCEGMCRRRVLSVQVCGEG